MIPRSWLSLLVAFLAIVASANAQAPKAGIADIYILDVGQGDSILLRSPEGKTALIDAGPSKDVVKTLRKLGVESLDLAVVTHHHLDHFGGMSAAIKAFKPKFFLDSGSPQTSRQFVTLLETLKASEAQVLTTGPAARRIDLGSMRLSIFPQPDFDKKEENNNSVGIRAQYGTFSILLTGDAEEPLRRFWLNNVPELCADVTVLKLAHHGSRNGTSLPWLLISKPKLAVASLAAKNDYGHPHAETLAVLRRTGIPLRRTDENGTIHIQTDGRRWRVVDPNEPNRGPPESTAKPPVPENPNAGLIDLNTAEEDELRTLPGIGPTLAKRIIEGRPYATVEDVKSVEGLGPKKLDAIREKVFVSEPR